MTDHRNEIAKARDKWIESDAGKICTEGSAQGQYLRNRIELAFVSGYNAAAPNPTPEAQK